MCLSFQLYFLLSFKVRSGACAISPFSSPIFSQLVVCVAIAMPQRHWSLEGLLCMVDWVCVKGSAGELSPVGHICRHRYTHTHTPAHTHTHHQRWPSALTPTAHQVSAQPGVTRTLHGKAPGFNLNQDSNAKLVFCCFFPPKVLHFAWLTAHCWSAFTLTRRWSWGKHTWKMDRWNWVVYFSSLIRFNQACVLAQVIKV